MVEVRTPSNKLLLGSISPGVYSDLSRLFVRVKCHNRSQSSEDFQWWKFVLQVTSCYLEVSRLEFILTRPQRASCNISRWHTLGVAIQRGLPMVEVRTPSNKLLLGSISPGVYSDVLNGMGHDVRIFDVAIQRGLPMVEVRTPSNKLLLGSISPGVYSDEEGRIRASKEVISVAIQRGLPMVEVRTPSNKLLLGSISPGVYSDEDDLSSITRTNELSQSSISPGVYSDPTPFLAFKIQ